MKSGLNGSEVVKSINDCSTFVTHTHINVYHTIYHFQSCSPKDRVIPRFSGRGIKRGKHKTCHLLQLVSTNSY